MAYNHQNTYQQSAHGSVQNAQPGQHVPAAASVFQQDPNAHYDTPPGYVLVPISQIGAQQPSPYGRPPPYVQPAPSSPYGLPTQPAQIQPLPSPYGQQPSPPHAQPNFEPPAPPLPPRPAIPAVQLSHPQSSPALTFPTSTPFTLVGHHISDTKEVFLPQSAPLDSPSGYETHYRALDYTNRKDWHTTVYAREPSATGKLQTRLAGNCMYHRYWSNSIQMMMPYLKGRYEFDQAWMSDVGVCDGRRLDWRRADASELQQHASPQTGKTPIFVLDCAETNDHLVTRVLLDTMQSCRIQVWEPMKNQEQLDEQVVMAICVMHRMRFKVKKDEKAWLKDEDWDALGKFTKTANGVLGIPSV